MRNDQARLLNDPVAVEQQVEVDRARPPVGSVTLAAQLPLDVEEQVEERPRFELGLDLGDGVQELRLLLVSPRLGFDDRREPSRPDQRRGFADRRFPVAEVRAKPYVGEGRHPSLDLSTVTALNSTGSPAGRTCGLRTRTLSHRG